MTDAAGIAAVSDLSGLPAAQVAAVEAAYAVPVRAYHHFGHVREVLRHAGEVATDPGWRQPAEVRLAILYHDAIYVPGRQDNEARSAELALEHLRRWPADVDAGQVAALINLTAPHGRLAADDPALVAAGPDAALFLDCDMAILGAAPAVFDAYDRGIAAEYRGHVAGWRYAIGRRRFLKQLLAAPRIFLSGPFHARLDAAARTNLRRAVTRKQ